MSPVVLTALAIFAASAGYALWRGGPPERVAAEIITVWILSDVGYHQILGPSSFDEVDPVHLVLDGAELAARTQDKFSAVAQFVREVRTAGPSITVVKTTIGSAGSVAAAIDKAGWSEVAGTVSGDDTIFIATADARAQARVLDQLRNAFGV